MKQRIGQIGNTPLVIGDEHEVTSNEILIEQSKTDPNKIDIKRRINGKLKKLTSEGTIKVTQPKPKIAKTYLQTPKFNVYPIEVSLQEGTRYPRYSRNTRYLLPTFQDQIEQIATRNQDDSILELLEGYKTSFVPLFIGELYEGVNIVSLRELFRGHVDLTLNIERSDESTNPRYFDIDTQLSNKRVYTSDLGNLLATTYKKTPLVLLYKNSRKGEFSGCKYEKAIRIDLDSVHNADYETYNPYIVIYVEDGNIKYQEDLGSVYFKNLKEFSEWFNSSKTNKIVDGYYTDICNHSKFYDTLRNTKAAIGINQIEAIEDFTTDFFTISQCSGEMLGKIQLVISNNQTRLRNIKKLLVRAIWGRITREKSVYSIIYRIYSSNDQTDTINSKTMLLAISPFMNIEASIQVNKIN